MLQIAIINTHKNKNKKQKTKIERKKIYITDMLSNRMSRISTKVHI
jgi:hypothetical protein